MCSNKDFTCIVHLSILKLTTNINYTHRFENKTGCITVYKRLLTDENRNMFKTYGHSLTSVITNAEVNIMEQNLIFALMT